MSDYEFCRCCGEVDYSCDLICRTCESLMWWRCNYSEWEGEGSPIPGTNMLEPEYMEKVFWPQRRRIQIIDHMKRRAPILARAVDIGTGRGLDA